MSKKKTLVISSIAISVLVIAGVSVYLLTPKKTVIPNAEKATKEEVIQFVTSKKFSQVPIADRVKFIESLPESQIRELMRGNNLNDTEKQQVRKTMEKVRRYQMQQRMEKFFTATQDEQNRILDEDIARLDQMRANRPQRNNATPNDNQNNNNPNNPPRTPPTAQNRRDRDASMDPVTSARMRIYFDQMRKRREAQKK